MPEAINKKSVFFWSCFGLLWAFIPVFYFPRLFFDAAFISSQDPLQLEFVAKVYFYGSLNAGSFSLLYPDNLLGISYVANPVYGVFYPPSLFYLFFNPINAFKTVFVLHYILLGLGWTLLLNRMVKDLWVSAATATIFVGSGLVYSFHHVAMVDLQSSTWVPWIALFFLVFIDSKRPMMLFLSSICAAFAYLGGDPLSAGFGWLIALCFGAKDVRTNGRMTAIGLLSAVTMFLVFVSPFLRQSVEFFPISERAVPFSRYEAMGFSFYPLRLIEMIAPVFSQQIRDYYAASMSGDFGTRYWFPSVAIGLSTFMFFCVGCFNVRKHKLLAVFLAGFLCLMVLALGKHIFVSSWIWEHAPVLKNMRYPERMLKYALVLILPIVCFGLLYLRQFLTAKTKLAPGIIVVLLMAIPLIEISSTLPPASLANLEDLAIRAPFDQLLIDRISGVEPRLGLCSMAGVSDKGAISLDTRLWQIPMLIAPDSSDMLVTKYIPCEHFSNRKALQWLGLSHIVMADASDAAVQAQAIETYGLKEAQDLEGVAYQLFRMDESGPSLALLTDSFSLQQFLGPLSFSDKGVPEVNAEEVMSQVGQGHLFIDPRFILESDGHLAPMPETTAKRLNQAAEESRKSNCANGSQSVAIELDLPHTAIRGTVNASCLGLLSLPWRFIPGWRILVNGQPQEFVRVNDLTLGIILQPGESRFEASFAPPGWGASVWITTIFFLCMFLFCLRVKNLETLGRR